jgi:type IX secretion system PorP/SprF family membrane protein
MGKKFLIVLAVLSASVQGVRAQWDVQFTDFTTLRSYYNPAVSGTDGLLDVSIAYSLQMAGYDGAPKTMYAGAHMPIYFFGPRHGAGISLFSDEIGIFKTSKLSAQYSFNMKLGEKGRIAVGVQGGMLNEKIEPGNMILSDANDPAFPTSTTEGKHFDFAAGVYYYSPKIWAGLSSMHLAAPTIEMGEKYEIELARTYYFMAGGNIKLKNTLLSLQPAVMVQTDFQSWREDIQCKAFYEYDAKTFFAGVGYSPGISVTAMIGGNFHGVQLGYSYQMYTQGVGAIHGTHELVLNYKTNLDLFKKGKNLHKSARFL